MALSREKKEQIVDELKTTLQNSKGVVFADYKGLSVPEFEKLRTKLREQDARIKVAKLTLMRRALEDAGLDVDLDVDVPTAIAYSEEDEVIPAKVLADFAEEVDKLDILFGILEGKMLKGEEVESLAKLPGKQELKGQVVGVLAGPMRGMAGVLSGVQRNFVYALKAVADQKSA